MGRAGAADEEQYDRVVDITEAGADNSGEEPIDDVFAEEAQDDTLLKFPPGEYRANQLIVYQLSNFAMVGDDATLVPGDDYDEDLWLAGSEVDGVRIENFTLDHTAEGVAPEIDITTVGSLTIRNVEKQGFHPGTGTAFGFRTDTADSEVFVENLQLPDGGKAVGIYGTGEGPMTFQNCLVKGFTNNGLYASNISASVTVEGGLFKDNNIAQVRLGGPDSVIRNAQLEVTRPVKGPDSDIVNMRGVRVADGPGPVQVENCDIWLRGSQGTGGIVTAYSGGSLDVVDTQIYVDPEYTTPSSDGGQTSFGVFVDSEGDDTSEGTRTFDGVSITGGGQSRAGMLLRRDDNTITNLCLDQSGETRNGIIFEGSSNNVLSDSTVDVPDEEIILRDSSVKKANVATSGSCPSPSDSTDSESTDDSTTEETDDATPEEETDDATPEEETDDATPEEETDDTTPEEETDDTTPEEETDDTTPEEETDDATTEEATEETAETTTETETSTTSETSSQESSSSGDESSSSDDGDSCDKN
jgi:hypothetical protein